MSRNTNLQLLKALSVETRYRIVEELLKGERCACEIPSLIHRTQSNTSMHLSMLADSGILKSRREGKKILYSIKDKRVGDVFMALKIQKASDKKDEKMKKIQVPTDYPPEEGCYLRGNDYSPVAVAVILKWAREETPKDIESLVRTGIESGAALSGTLQTENVGLEKVICNVIANPNIRYLVVCGPETPGHLTGDAIRALYENGIGKDKKIIGTEAPTPLLYNIPQEWIERFLHQTKLVYLINEGSPDIIRNAVWSCYQESPTRFKDYELWDMGAYDADPICGKITWKVTNPNNIPADEKEEKALNRTLDMINRLREKNKKQGDQE